MDKVKIPAEVADMTPVLVTSMPPGDAPTAMDTDVSYSATELATDSIKIGTPKGVPTMTSGIPEGMYMTNDIMHSSPDPMLRTSRGTNPLLSVGVPAAPEPWFAGLLMEAHSCIKTLEGEFSRVQLENIELRKELNSYELELVKQEYQIHELKKDRLALEARAQTLSEQLRDLSQESGPQIEDSHP